MTNITPPLSRRERRRLEEESAGLIALQTSPVSVVQDQPAQDQHVHDEAVQDEVVQVQPVQRTSAPALNDAVSPPTAGLTRRELRAIREQLEKKNLPENDDKASVKPEPTPLVSAVALEAPVFPEAKLFPEPVVPAAAPVTASKTVPPALVEPPVFLDTLPRDLGEVPVSTNTLVLPEVPEHDFTTAPLTDRGDVVVTGSIVLPASLAGTGALQAQIEDSANDDLSGAGGDLVTVPADLQPVRASSAVSVNADSPEIVNPVRLRRGNRLLVGLIIASGALALIVVGLLALTLFSGVLN